MHSRMRPALACALLAVGCASQAPQRVAPADTFIANLAPYCGNAYAGRVVQNEPRSPEDPFEGKQIVAHVRACSAERVEIPLHVGDDRSRTWVLTRTSTGVRLKHDHRHHDGSSDAVTMYGGDTTSAGTAVRQEFPVDSSSRALFTRAGLTVSTTNVWALELDPGKTLVYELSRPGRIFRLELDLTRTVPTPPAPWGH